MTIKTKPVNPVISPTSMGEAVNDILKLLKSDCGEEVYRELEKLVADIRLFRSSKAIRIPANPVDFVAREKFVKKKEGVISELNISYLNEYFVDRFLLAGGKVEKPTKESFLQYHQILREESGGHIISELGGEALVETTLYELSYLLKKKPNGEEGLFAIDKNSIKIFCIRDNYNVLQAVRVFWYKDGWAIASKSLKESNIFGVGNYVLIRVSV